MSFRKQEINYLLCDTAVENIFISEYAKYAPGDYIKVYLMGLMYAGIDREFDNETLSKALDMSGPDIARAWDYWQKEGLVKKITRDTSKPNNYEVEFICIKEKFSKSGDRAADASVYNEQLASLLKDIESVTGRLLEAGEPELAAGYLKDYRMDPALVLFAYRYCVQNKRPSGSHYVAKIIGDWFERGFENVQQAEAYLGENDRRYSFYRQVFRLLGFRRNPTMAEEKVMDSWIDELKVSGEDVKKACLKTSGISNPSINYIDAVLRNSRDKEETPRDETDFDALYEKVRERNARKTAQNRASVYRAVPQLKSIMDGIRECSFAISKDILLGASGKDRLEADRKKQQALYAEKDRLLVLNGFEKNALDNVYSCMKCRDSGLLENSTRCSCYAARLAEYEKNG